MVDLALAGKPDDDTPKPLLDLELGMGPLTPGGLPWGAAAIAGSNTVVNRPIVTVKQTTEMRRRDGQARALFQLITLPLRLALQTGEWTDADDKGETPEAKFANDMFNTPPVAGGMTTTKTKLFRQMLLACADGFAPFEIVRQVPDDGPLAGKITLRKLAYRDPNTIQFLVDKNGGYRGFRQVTQLANMEPIDVTIPADKSVVFTVGDEQNPYYGVSMFESAYPHWDAKRKLYYIAHIAAQFAAVPGRLGKIPIDATPAQIAEFRSALAAFAMNTSMLLPPGFDVVPFNGNTGYDFMKLIDHHNLQMSKSILAGFFDQEQRTVLIENNASESVDADFFLLSMATLAEDFAETLSNHLMPQFIDYNFPNPRYPVFKPGELNDTTKDAIREMFKTVVVSSVLNSTPEFVRELEKKVSSGLNLDIDYDEIEKQEQQAAEQEAEQAQQAAQQPPGAPTDPNAPQGPPNQPPGAPGGSGGQPAPAGGQPPSPDSGGGAAPAPASGPTAVAASQAQADLEAAVNAETVDVNELVKAAQALFMFATPDDDPVSVDDVA